MTFFHRDNINGDALFSEWEETAVFIYLEEFYMPENQSNEWNKGRLIKHALNKFCVKEI